MLKIVIIICNSVTLKITALHPEAKSEISFIFLQKRSSLISERGKQTGNVGWRRNYDYATPIEGLSRLQLQYRVNNSMTMLRQGNINPHC